MPRISSFYGITIWMYYDEIHHLGRPHFHARYRLTMALMRSTPLLTEATASEDYTVHVRFEDGLTADVDLSYLLAHGGVFEPLRDLEFFRRLRADGEAGTIVWPNEADIAPETLYAHAQRQAATTSQ